MSRLNITRRLAVQGLLAAGLGFFPRAKAIAYSPGKGLEIAKYDRPGDGSVNSYILIGPNSLVILDCQRTAIEARQVVALARGLALPVESIVLSHEHPDHVVGLEVVARAFPQAPILASEVTRDAVAKSAKDVLAFMKRGFGAAIPDTIPLPTRIIRPGERLMLAGAEWTVDQLGPCEAEGMTMLYSEANGILFAADLFGNRVTPWLVDGHTTDWMNELEKAAVRYQGVAMALPGHGAAAPATALINEQLGYLRYMRGEVQAEAQAGTLTDAARARIRVKIEARYAGYPKVAPPPNLIDLNADSVAKELAAR